MVNMSRLLKAFRTDTIDEVEIARAQREGFAYWKLESASTVMEPPLTHLFPLDDGLFEALGKLTAKSKLAGKRLGVDWDVSNPKVVSRKSEDDHWVEREQLKPLDDVCTRFCTNHFFSNAHTRVNMIANIIRVYDRLAEKAGLDYRIVFKGGVMMRLLLVEFLHDMKVDVRHKMIEYMSTQQRAVGISDFDFEIVPHAHNPVPETTRRHLIVNYAVLLWVQKHMERELEGKAPPVLLMNPMWDFKDDAVRLRDMLREAVNDLPRDHPMSGIRVDHVHIVSDQNAPPMTPHRTRSHLTSVSRRTNLIIFRCRTRDDTCVVPASDFFHDVGMSEATRRFSRTHGALYATLNTYIGEGVERTHRHHLRSLFHLARIKHSFVMYYTTPDGSKRMDRLSGEMVDLSQSDGVRHDESRSHLYNHIRAPYCNYHILGVPSDTATIHSYTVEGFFHEMQCVLHRSSVAPWEVPKVAKRVVRYVMLLVMLVAALDVAVPRKARAVNALIDRLQSADAVADGSMLRTGIHPVDSFFWHERASVRIHEGTSVGRRNAYYKRLHGNLKMISRYFFEHIETTAWSRKGVTYMNSLHMEHFTYVRKMYT